MQIDADTLFVVGVISGFLAFPALLSAFTHQKPLSTVMTLVMVSAGCMTAALVQKPTGYTIETTPNVVFDVIGRLVN